MSAELIAALSDPMVRELANRGSVRSFPKNTVIINEGDRGESMFVILGGKVKVYVSDDDGREMILDIYGVARLLLSLAREQPDGRLVVPDRMTQQDIADRVGASRDMISRIFKDLTIGGYVTVVDRIITINRKPPARW
jgi:CRP/FNR family cyclic AMP-dependent transcriptional regulator